MLRPSESLRTGRMVDSCALCGHDSLYIQKDFNRALGIAIVVIGVGASIVLFARSNAFYAMLDRTAKGCSTDSRRRSITSGGLLRAARRFAMRSIVASFSKRVMPRWLACARLTHASAIQRHQALIGTAVVDAIIYFLVGEVAVCYACHTIYRGFEPNPGHAPFNLELLERYGGQARRK